GHTDDAKKWMILYERVKDAVNKIAWDEEWYIRAFSDRANPLIPIGGYRNGEKRIFLNAQSWSILSGIASSKQAARSLASVKKHLMSDYGPMIFYPSYSHYIDYIGTQSIYAPGFRNACIYPRPAGWAIAAACLSNQPELANEMYNKTSLVSRAKDMANFQCEPYAYTENFVGPDNRLKGKGEFQWNFGEGASWMWASYVDYILGVRPVWKGLLIDPKIPYEWTGFKIKRPFRGCVYDVRVKNPEKVSSGVVSVKVDGHLINGSTISAFNDGKTHIVEVNMGRS
ncbi:MAG: GH36-type glycosyl hydrolase domain-containing protein, partial [Candidatus Saccharimonadales bacterium]